jgi:hypothetical protein
MTAQNIVDCVQSLALVTIAVSIAYLSRNR